MGLDMCLYKFPKIHGNKLWQIIENESLREEVGYWRKAYDVYDWFELNLKKIDEGYTEDYYEVTYGDLQNLLQICEKELKTLSNNPMIRKSLLSRDGEFLRRT